MASSYAGLYGRVKDGKTPVGDRLKLVRYAWCCPRVYLPNKKQVLIDVVCGLLLHKNRKHICDDDVALVWECLLQLLTSASSQFTHDNSLLVKPSLCQVLIDNLQNAVTKGDNSSYLHRVIGCCLVLISSPALSYVFTTKFDNLISLVSILCQLCTKQSLDSEKLDTKQSLDNEKSDLFTLLGHVTTAFAKGLSVQANQKPVLQLVVEKLLVSVMMLLQVAMVMPAEKNLCGVADQLRAILESALFHKDNESSFHIYLTVLYGADHCKFQPPKTIENFFHVFSQLMTGKVPAKCPNMSSERCKTVISSYLPLFFKNFVEHNRNNTSFSFKMFIHICDLIGLTSSESDRDSLTATQVVTVTDACLQVVLQSNLYIVSHDNATGRTQFAFFKHLVGQLLKIDRDPHWYDCLRTIIQLNHGILEPRMTNVLMCAWMQTRETNSAAISASIDDFLRLLVSTYSKLHQIPRWFDFVLGTIKTNSPVQPFLSMPPTFSQRLAEIVACLPQTTMLEVWQKLAEEVKSYLTLKSENKEFDQGHNLLQVCQIYHHFLSNVKVADYSVTELSAAKILNLMASMETDILVPLFRMCIENKKDSAGLNSALLLCLAHGELKILLALYCDKHRARIGKAATVSHLSDITLVHSYLTSKDWEKLFSKIVHSKEKTHLYLLDRLSVQKVKACLVFCEDVEVQTATVANSLEMILNWLPEISCNHSNTSWSLGVENVNEDNYCVARWGLIVENASVLLPRMTSDQIFRLGEFVLSTFEYQKHSNLSEGQASVTLSSITAKFFTDPIVMETRQLVSSIIISFLITLGKSLSPSNSPKKKRKHSGTMAAILDGLKKLENSEVLWHLPVDSELVEHLQLAAVKVNEVLQADDWGQKMCQINNTRIIQILHQLPLYYLNPGSQLQCIFGLIFITTLIFNQSESSNQSSQTERSVQQTSIEILSVLLDSAVDSCPVFQLMHPGKFFHWLQRLLCAADSQNLSTHVGDLMEVTARAVIGDAGVMPGIEDFIYKLADEMTSSIQHLDTTSVTAATSAEKARFTLASYLLQSIVKQMKKYNQTSEVLSACRKYFSALSSVFTNVITKMRVRQGDTTLLTPSHPIIHGFSSMLLYGDFTSDAKCLSEETMTATQFVLDFALEHIVTTKFEDYKMDLICLEFIKTICRCRDNIPAVCKEETFAKIWSALIKMMTTLRRSKQKVMTSSKCVDSGQHKAMTSSKNVCGDMTVADMLSLKRETTVVGKDESSGITNQHYANRSEMDDVTDFKTDQWKTRMNVLQNTITMAILSCDSDQFKSLLMGLVNDMTPANVGKNSETIVMAVEIWCRVLSSQLSEDQGREIARISQHVIMNCQDVLRVIGGTQDEDVVNHVAVPVITAQAQMIQFGAILMSSQLAIECLHSCLLVPLEGVSYETFIPAFRAVYSVLNTLLLNHTDHMLQAIPSFVAAATRLVKGLIVYGSQSKLKSDTGQTDGIVQCAHLLTKLLELMGSHAVEFGKVSVYMLADYTSEVQKTTLLPVVKKAMLPGIYSIVHLCDDHGVAHLHTALPLGVRDVFHMLYTDYKKHFRYSGRI